MNGCFDDLIDFVPWCNSLLPFCSLVDWNGFFFNFKQSKFQVLLLTCYFGAYWRRTMFHPVQVCWVSLCTFCTVWISPPRVFGHTAENTLVKERHLFQKLLTQTVWINGLLLFLYTFFFFIRTSQSNKKYFWTFSFFVSRNVEKKLFSFCLSRSGLFVLEWSTPIFVKTFCSMFAFWHSLVYDAKKGCLSARFWSILCKHIGSTTQTLLSPFFLFVLCCLSFSNVMLCYS